MPILRPIIVALLPLARWCARGLCAINNTTVATGGSPKTLRSEVFNVAAGYLYEPPKGS